MRTRDTEKKHKKRQKISHGRTRNFTEKTGRRKDILATEFHGIARKKAKAETRKKVRKDRRLDTEKIVRRKVILATE